MDLSRKLLEDKEFPSSRKGYDQQAVDDFLERVGVSVEDLQSRLNEAMRRLDHLEVLGGPQPAGAQSLALAQKAARETRQSAERDAEAMRKGLAEEKKLFESEAEQLIVALEQQKKQLDAAQLKAENSGPNEDEQAQKVLAEAQTAATELRQEIEARAALEIRDLEKAREETRILRDEADRYSLQTKSEVDALASEAEDLLTGAQQAAKDIMEEARARAQEVISAANTQPPLPGEANQEHVTVLAEAQVMRDKAEERVQQATLLRDEAELLMTSARSSAELTQATSLTGARKQIADERRKVRLQADGIFATAQREREALLSDARAEISELLVAAKAEVAAIGKASVEARDELDRYQALVDEAKVNAESIASETVVESSRLISAAQAVAEDKATEVRNGLKGELSDLERARADLRFELGKLDGQLETQKVLLSDALAEVAAIDTPSLDAAAARSEDVADAADLANGNRPMAKQKQRKRRRKK